MRKWLHLVLGLSFVVALVGEMMFWAGAASLPQGGPLIRQSLGREAPLAFTYLIGGEVLGKAAPMLLDIGQHWAAEALEPGLERIKEDPNVSAALILDNTWNSTHRLAKLGLYGTPILLLLAIFAWLRRPRQVRMMGGRR
ncbi:MAG TPA: hypothetical protein VM555_10945 [Tahibacter sp.]|nr:hypothetical protein [Tahibacter sp.]